MNLPSHDGNKGNRQRRREGDSMRNTEVRRGDDALHGMSLCMAITYIAEYGSTGFKVANPARGQLNREDKFSLSHLRQNDEGLRIPQ